MRAVRLTANGLLQDDSLPVPEPGPHEALIRVRLAGICSTDLELVKGYFGFSGVLGHEFVGEVEACNDPSWQGRRVVSSINFADANSPEYVEFGFEHHPHRQVLGILNHDGAMADYVCVPMANLFPVPDALSNQEAVFTEPLAAALRIREQLTVKPSWRICVLGPGRLGMLIAQVLRWGGSDVSVLGRSQTSLELPRDMGFSTGTAAQFGNSCFDLVVEATGSPVGMADAIRLTKPLGTLVLKSTFFGTPELDLTKIVVDEIKLVGSRCGPFGAALRVLAAKQIDVASLVDGEYPIEKAMQAFDHAARSGTRKILLSL